MIRVIRELVYTYEDPVDYLHDSARWTAEFKWKGGANTMRSMIVNVRRFDDPPQPD